MYTVYQSGYNIIYMYALTISAVHSDLSWGKEEGGDCHHSFQSSFSKRHNNENLRPGQSLVSQLTGGDDKNVYVRERVCVCVCVCVLD